MSNKKNQIEMPRCAMVDLISHIKDLPSREKPPDEVLKLSDLFKMNDFLNEAKSLIKRGYSYNDLSQIVSEKCGSNVSARRIKYFITYSNNTKKRRNKRASSQKLPRKGGVEQKKTSCNPVSIETNSEANLLQVASNLQEVCMTSSVKLDQKSALSNQNPSEIDGKSHQKEVNNDGSFVIDMQEGDI